MPYFSHLLLTCLHSHSLSVYHSFLKLFQSCTDSPSCDATKPVSNMSDEIPGHPSLEVSYPCLQRPLSSVLLLKVSLFLVCMMTLLVLLLKQHFVIWIICYILHYNVFFQPTSGSLHGWWTPMHLSEEMHTCVRLNICGVGNVGEIFNFWNLLFFHQCMFNCRGNAPSFVRISP